MSENLLIERSKSFAVDSIHLCDGMRTRGKASAIIKMMDGLSYDMALTYKE